jgi:hypothetical protein
MFEYFIDVDILHNIDLYIYILQHYNENIDYIRPHTNFSVRYLCYNYKDSNQSLFIEPFYFKSEEDLLLLKLKFNT